jgi:5-methylcytosine-specific restriction protein A
MGASTPASSVPPSLRNAEEDRAAVDCAYIAQNLGSRGCASTIGNRTAQSRVTERNRESRGAVASRRAHSRVSRRGRYQLANVPVKPPHPCARPGCRALIRIGSFCDAHRPARPSARAQGYNARWDRYSKDFLRRNPFCVDPFRRHPGHLVPATVTGHKQAHRGNEALLWDTANHYALCSACNAYQCAKFEGGFGRASQPLTQSESKTAGASTNSLTDTKVVLRAHSE